MYLFRFGKIMSIVAGQDIYPGEEVLVNKLRLLPLQINLTGELQLHDSSGSGLVPAGMDSLSCVSIRFLLSTVPVCMLIYGGLQSCFLQKE